VAKLSAAERLVVAVEQAAVDAEPGTPSRHVAEEFYETQSGFVEPFARTWIIEALARMIGSHRAKIRRAANPQLVFEGVLGFKHLPPKIETKDGKKIARADATMGVLRMLASQLGAKETPAQREVQQAIILMSKYTAENQRITWAEVVELEAGKKGGKV
jgi:hypothetical protein